jgi:hypothetical protein
MICYKPLYFDPTVLEQLRTGVMAVVGRTTNRTTFVNHFSPELQYSINTQLRANGLPRYRSCMVFRRSHLAPPCAETAHIDGNGVDYTYCSVVVPIQGCIATRLHWFHGDYTTVPGEFTDLSGHSTQFDIVWNGPGVPLDSVSIVDQPYLCRVDIPHDYHRNTVEDRITCTFRLEGNPRFESFI